ncbi:MAG: urease accessory protein UreD [Alphaproteobacteria bacterium]|nr:urease accessory protein UreD [Alphaproteobacteria bacterium]
MYDASLRCDVAAAGLQRADGACALSFARRGGERAALTGLYQRTPCRAMFPEPEEGDPPLAVLLTTTGGLTGGDAVAVSVAVADGAVVVSSQAAEKIYRSLGPDVTVEVELAIGDGARLEYYPQETILFDGARLRRRTAAHIAAGGSLAAAEMLVFGRVARGERITRGRLFDGWQVRYDGRLVWVDRLALDRDIAGMLDDPLLFDGARAIATAVHVGAEAAALLPLARELADGAATVVNGVLIARIFGPSPGDVRVRLIGYLAGLRGAVGLPPRLPRVWHV